MQVSKPVGSGVGEGVGEGEDVPSAHSGPGAPQQWARRWALAAGGAWVLAGCGPKVSLPKRPQEMAALPMQPADVMPKLDQDSLSRRTRVVVLRPEDSPSARGVGLPEVAAAALESLLGAGGVEVVDRKLATKLESEIKVADMRGSGNMATYSGPEVADFAVSVVMGNASWGSEFIPAASYTDKKGRVTNTPASHTHRGKSAMTVRIFELPSLRLLVSVPLEGTVSKVGQQSAAGPQQSAGLMRDATEDGIRDAKGPVLNEFSPKGYITERRVHEKVSYFRTLLSKQSGAQKGQSVDIFTLERSVDPLTKRATVNTVQVAKGVVSELVSDEHSYIVVDDEKAAARVRLGDIVRVKHDPSFWDNLRLPKISIPGFN